MDFLALDIGWVNLKMANGTGFAEARHFDLWQHPRQLSQELRTLIAEAPGNDHLLVTMTGEMADCFASKSEGVEFILSAIDTASDGRHTRVYLTNGNMVTPQIAVRNPLLAATSSWHVLARFAGRYARSGPGLLVSVGSTTCNAVPLVDGEIAATGHTDMQRLLSGELIYTGVERSPLCALATAVPYRGQNCPLAQEVFATTRDIYLILGDLPEEPTSEATADGRGATKACARARLARSICANDEEFNHKDAVTIAQAVAESQLVRIAAGVEQVVTSMASPPTTIMLAGRGEYLARRVLDRLQLPVHVVSLSKQLGPHISRCAPAHALAVLAREASGL